VSETENPAGRPVRAVVVTPELLAAALSAGSLAVEYVRQPHVVAQWAAWLRAEGARDVAFTDEDLSAGRLEQYDVVLTELAYRQGTELAG
jgi:hypothetical protein